MLALSACATGGPQLPPAPLDMALGPVHDVPLSVYPNAFFETESGLIVAAAERDRERILSSTDDGASWAVRGELPLVPRVWTAHDGCPDLHRIELLDEGLYHLRGLDEAGPRARIADSAHVELSGFALGSAHELGVAWIARGRGWPELLFSRSEDHGSTWSLPVRVNTESRRKEIAGPSLLHRRRGWVLTWTENRDARTLFDVYGSLSEDGRDWSASRRLNDDQEPSFSVHASAVEDGRMVHVLSQDYRDLNRFGDRDANIYYARMADDPAADLPNVRVNDVTDGPQSDASLTRDAKTGALVAVWLDARNWLTGDIYASASADSGASWIRNRRVNVNARPEVTLAPWLTARRAGGVFVGWKQTHAGVDRTYIRRITPGEPAEASAEEPPAAKPQGPAIDPLPQHRLVAENRFDGDVAVGIEPIAGSWVLRDGVLLSFGTAPTLAEWKVPALADFVLEGRFRLDPRQHVAAHVFLRARRTPDEPDVIDGYQLRNHFRRGVLLMHTRSTTGAGDRPPSWNSEPLTDRWFPFLQDDWYQFRAVVVGRRLDYWIDGEWMLSYDALDPRPGAIVLGGDARAPVEWDDLRFYALDSSQAASSP